MHVAIDPGLSGGVAWLHGPDLSVAGDMPVAGGRIITLSLAVDADILPVPSTVGIEDLIPVRFQGVESTLTTGVNWGRVASVYESRGHVVVPIPPKDWKDHFGLSSDKEASRLLAITLWPDMEHLFRRKRDEARAEAALIGRYMHEIGLV